MDKKRISEIASHINAIKLGDDGVFGIMDKSIQMDRAVFECVFPDFETVPHSHDYAKLTATVDGVEFYSLATYKIKSLPPLRDLTPIEED